MTSRPMRRCCVSADGTARSYNIRGRFFNIGVNGLKGGLYKALRITDQNQRGFVDFPQGLEDNFFEQLTSEKRVLQVDRRGFASMGLGETRICP